MLAQDWQGAHEIKSRMGALSNFDLTIFLDTDIYVNGDLSPLFEIAGKGELAIYRHKSPSGIPGHWNSGVMAFNRELGLKLASEWGPHKHAVAARTSQDRSTRNYYLTDQKSLNEIIGRFPIHPLSGLYNYMIPERTLEDEALDFDKVRIFHFIHKSCKEREQSRAYRIWMEL